MIGGEETRRRREQIDCRGGDGGEQEKKGKEEMGEEGCEWKRGDERRGKEMFLSVCPVANLISLATP